VRALAEPMPPMRPAAGGSRWADLGPRALSAAVMLPLALYCLFAGGWAWNAMVLAATVALLWEWWRMWRLRPGGRPALSLLGGWAYMLAGAASLHWLRADSAVGLMDVLFLLAVVWSSDIGAYVAGRVIGGPKLAPRISPGKTWSGALGGLAAAMLVGLLVSRQFAPGPLSHVLLVAAVLSVASMLGDLLESACKRHYGVKDSSRLIPGHGGVFDRLDGVLGAAPVAVAVALALGPGVELWR
jgi:phosphatidate cytidylyltransferase